MHNYNTPTSHTGPYTNSVAKITVKQCEQFINNQQHQDRSSFEKIYQVAKLQSTNHKLAVIICKKQTHQDLARYQHAACFSPVKHTWIKAIKRNHFISWPGLTQDLLQKNLPLSHATVQGHMKKQRKNLQSTKTKGSLTSSTTTPKAALQEHFPESPTPNTKNHQVAYIVIDKDELNTAYQDLTGRFPIRFTQGNEYILIGYHYNSNCIIAHPVKNRTAQVLPTAWENLQHTFANAGTAPNVWVMDNEI